MQITKSPNTTKLVAAFIGGVLVAGLYKLYLYTTNRSQFEDSNLLISVVFVLVATAVIFLILKLISGKR